METRGRGVVLAPIRTLFSEGRIGTLSDAQLLEQFVARRVLAAEAELLAEAAFEVLVLRHGPMVLAACRRVLRDPHEVEDAFQATFLILARRAGSIRKREVVGGWLRKVAHRVAARARERSIRRNELAPIQTISPAEEPGLRLERADLYQVVLDEVQLLPEKYRHVVQLCYIEGQTHDEAARRLAWPVGTVRTRLAWARERLRDRLTQRGLIVPAGVIAASLVSSEASAGVPARLVKATVESASGRVAAGTATALATSVLRATLVSQLKLVALFILAAGLVTGVALGFARTGPGNATSVAASARGQAQNPRPADAKPESLKAASKPRAPTTVLFDVVDRSTRHPLQGVTVKVWIDGKLALQQITDELGRVVIPLPETEPERLTITTSGDGLVPMRVYLRQSAAQDFEIPQSYTLAMERGTSIGGIVRDEGGRPIEGVTVTLYKNGPADLGREAFDAGAITARTDVQGRWHTDLIPSGLDRGYLHFAFSHPEFLRRIDAVNEQSNATAGQLSSRTAVFVLRRGIAVAGRVLDRDGQPIAGASIRLGERGLDSPATTTDSRGRFRIGNAEGGDTYLVAEARGHAPEIRRLDIRAGLAPVEFRLGPGRTIRGRVVDPHGRPVAGAVLSAYHLTFRQTLSWRAETDQDGRFRWNDAPRGSIWVSASHVGYRSADESVAASQEECVLTLHSGGRIRGTVTDADTGRPVEAFTVIPGIRVAGRPPMWFFTFAQRHRNGRYTFSFDSPGNQPYRIRIDAKGYLPVISPEYSDDGGERVLDVRLKKGEWVEGTVVGADGAPLEGAEVILVTAEGIHITGGKTYQRDFYRHAVTGPDGRFAFPPVDGASWSIALHDRGYAEASSRQPAEMHRLTLQPWGRIEGTLRVGGKPLAYETVIASLDEGRIAPLNVAPVQYDSSAQTDAQGRFVIEHVAPGEASVYWQPNRSGGPPTVDRYYQPVFSNARPGATMHVDLVQEGGRPLLGRLIAPDAGARQPNFAQSIAFLELKLPEVPYPPGLPEQERRAWLSQWRLTPAGETYRHRTRGFGHAIRIQPDGSFRIDEVQAGEFVLNVRVPGYARITRDVSVPEPAAAQRIVPVDLGVLTLKQ